MIADKANIFLVFEKTNPVCSPFHVYAFYALELLLDPDVVADMMQEEVEWY